MSDNIMEDLFDKPQRKGGSGRIPDAYRTAYKPYVNERYTCPPELHDRLLNYCNDEERAKSWVIQKALEMWLTSKGY